MRIFISSTIKDLHYVRDTLADKIENQLGHDPIRSEDIFNHTKEDTIRSCLSEVQNSDVYMLIIGERYGHIIEKTGRSITHEEYLKAKAFKKHTFVYIEQQTWKLYQRAPESLDANIVKFINEVGSSFRNNIVPFDKPQEIFHHLKQQLSHLLEDYIRTNLKPDEIHDIIKKYQEIRRHLRFLQALIYYSENADRVLANLLTELEADVIMHDYEELSPEPVVTLSNAKGSTLFTLSEGNKLVRIGAAGDIGDKSIEFDIDDPESYVASTFREQVNNIFESDNPNSELEFVICFPFHQTYVLTIHFIVEQLHYPYETIEEKTIVNEHVIKGIFFKNKRILNDFKHFLRPYSYEGE